MLLNLYNHQAREVGQKLLCCRSKVWNFPKVAQGVDNQTRQTPQLSPVLLSPSRRPEKETLSDKELVADQLNVSGDRRAWETYVKQAKTQSIIRINPHLRGRVFSTLSGLSVTTQVGSGYHWQPASSVLALLLFTCFIKKGAVCLFVPCRALIKIREAVATKQSFQKPSLVSLAARLRAQTYRATDAGTIITIRLLSL